MSEYFTKEFEDFLNSDDQIFLIASVDTSYRPHDKILEKRKVNDNVLLIYYSEKEKEIFSSFTLDPLIMIDAKSKKPLFVIDLYNARYNTKNGNKDMIFAENGIETISNELYKKIDIFKKTIEQGVLKKLEANADSFLSDEIRNNYKDDALQCLVDSTAPSFDFEYSFDDTYKNINRLCFDYSAFVEDTINEMYEKCKDRYIKYINISKEYEDLKLSVEKNDNGKFKNKILDIFNSRKYKNIKIDYVYPDGTESTLEYGKEMNRYGWEQIKRNIISQEKISNIPIFSIKSIRWSRSTLLKASDYNIEYDEKKKEDDFIKLNNVDNFRKERYDDEEFAKRIVIVSDYNFKNISIRLKSKKDFVLELKEKFDVAPERLWGEVGSNLKTDLDFVQKFLSKNFSSYEQREIINSTPLECFDDINFIKFFVNNNFDINILATKMEDKMLFSREFIELIGDNRINAIPDDIIKTHSLEELEKIYTEEAIARRFHELNYTVLPQDKITKYITKREFREEQLFVKDGMAPSIVEYYADDEYMLYQLTNGIRSHMGAKKFLDTIHIDPEINNDDIIPFCSYNAFFLKTLNKDNQLTFLESEIANIDNYVSHDSYSATFETDYNEIELRYRYGEAEFNIKNKDNPSQFSYDRGIPDNIWNSFLDFVEEKTGKRPIDIKGVLDAFDEYDRKLEEARRIEESKSTDDDIEI